MRKAIEFLASNWGLFAQLVAGAWLGMGLKYRLSRWRSEKHRPGLWEEPAGLVFRGLGNLAFVATLEQVTDEFRGKIFYRIDRLFGLLDYVQSPGELLETREGDCDDHAWLHAQAVEYALGWPCHVVSYLAEDFRLSHHFAVAEDPAGQIWAIQVQAPRDELPGRQIVFGPFVDIEAAMHHSARDIFDTEVVAYDVRKCDPAWAVVVPWRKPAPPG